MCGLRMNLVFFRHPFDWTLLQKAETPSVHKRYKTRLTFLAACNFPELQKMSLMMIGKSARPKPSERRSRTELGFEYHDNSKARMNQELFFYSACAIRQLWQTPGYQLLLHIDNCSAHGKEDPFPRLRNVTINIFPPNTNSKIQPLDAIIIVWVNNCYRRRLLFCNDNTSCGKKTIYSANKLASMR